MLISIHVCLGLQYLSMRITLVMKKRFLKQELYIMLKWKIFLSIKRYRKNYVEGKKSENERERESESALKYLHE